MTAAKASTTAPAAVLREETTRAGSLAPPLRKLKSSLKLPNITKLFSTSNLSPKLVRFASKLEKVKMFDGRDSPSTVSVQGTPVGSPNFQDFDLNDYFSSHRNFTDLGLSEDSDSDSDSDTFNEYTKDKQYKISSLNFSAPKNIYDKQDCPVYLQQLALAADKKLLLLFVMCQNLAFEKQISVKVTLNNWQSTLIFNKPVHMKSFSSVNFDQFKFTIPLSRLPSSISAQFCIRYDVKGETFWDNNSTRNYNVLLSSYVSQKASPFVAQKPQRDTFAYKAPTFLPAPKHALTVSLDKPSSVSPYNYNELINKLILVSKAPDQKPALHHSASLPALRPRYSQSFRAKYTDKLETSITQSQTPAQAVTQPETKTTLKLIAVPKKVEHVGSFQDSKFNSTSYATLLQTYCFNGASSSPASSTGGSLTSSHSSSSSSVNLDFMTSASTFHSYGDSIYI